MSGQRSTRRPRFCHQLAEGDGNAPTFPGPHHTNFIIPEVHNWNNQSVRSPLYAPIRCKIKSSSSHKSDCYPSCRHAVPHSTLSAPRNLSSNRRWCRDSLSWHICLQYGCFDSQLQSQVDDNRQSWTTIAYSLLTPAGECSAAASCISSYRWSNFLQTDNSAMHVAAVTGKSNAQHTDDSASRDAVLVELSRATIVNLRCVSGLSKFSASQMRSITHCWHILRAPVHRNWICEGVPRIESNCQFHVLNTRNEATSSRTSFVVHEECCQFRLFLFEHTCDQTRATSDNATWKPKLLQCWDYLVETVVFGVTPSWHWTWSKFSGDLDVDNGGRCDLRVSFVLSVLRFFSRTFVGVTDKNTLSRVARMYSTCQNDSQTQHEWQTPIRNQHVIYQQLQSVDCSSWYSTSKRTLLTVFPPTLWNISYNALPDMEPRPSSSSLPTFFGTLDFSPIAALSACSRTLSDVRL